MTAKVALAILAAGMSKRFGGEPKQIAKLQTGERQKRFLAQIAIDEACASQASYVFLILGSHSSEIAGRLDLKRSQIVFNREYEKGLSTSIRSAIEAIPQDTDALILSVSDQPRLERTHFDLLIQKYNWSAGKIIALSFQGEPRNPVLFPKRYFKELSALSGDSGGKEVLRQHRGETILINIEERDVFLDIDSESDLYVSTERR